MSRDMGQSSPSRCFGECEREQFQARIKELEKCGEHRQDIIEILEGRVEELEQRLAIEEAHSEKHMAENQRLREALKKIHIVGSKPHTRLLTQNIALEALRAAGYLGGGE